MSNIHNNHSCSCLIKTAAQVDPSGKTFQKHNIDVLFWVKNKSKWLSQQIKLNVSILDIRHFYSEPLSVSKRHWVTALHIKLAFTLRLRSPSLEGTRAVVGGFHQGISPRTRLGRQGVASAGSSGAFLE